MSKVLATDLDGTLIPLEDQPENQRDLSVLKGELRDQQVTLTFVTGRHLESVADAIDRHCLPEPDWVICDVGTSVYRHEQGQFHLAEPYVQHLGSIVGEFSTEVVRREFASWNELRPQEDEKQGRFKLSFYCDAEHVPAFVERVKTALANQKIPYGVIGSVDPFNGDGLIDLLPREVSKAHALQWWTQHLGLPNGEAVFAGDSGNDLAALTAGYRSIVVGNAAAEVVRQVRDYYERTSELDKLYIAPKPATSGVLAGCRHFGLIE